MIGQKTYILLINYQMGVGFEPTLSDHEPEVQPIILTHRNELVLYLLIKIRSLLIFILVNNKMFQFFTFFE